MNMTIENDGGGLRHYLYGRPVHCGAGLLLRIADRGQETWVPVRYEASMHRDGIDATLHSHFGVILPDAETVLKWPSDELNVLNTTPTPTVRQIKVPDWVIQQLMQYRFKYSAFRKVLYAVLVDTDRYAGVCGDPDNGGYEWFISQPKTVETSDCGYGDSLLAFRDVLNKIVN